MSIDTPRGPLTARVTYGRLHVASEDGKPGSIKLASDHGLAALSWDGKYFGPVETHGFWGSLHLVGNSIQEKGAGRDDMDLHVDYGETDLRIGPLGDEKTYRDLFSEKD